ncbi:hypothetical protein [Pygmaiobacter massiliensis]|uniref:hypothetical protein n=1 Tax=Pygmaiobacter massiliensis TaxID=1917873 RepID=UPI00289FA585|nr:hypothetical protein [Pygmaiobacter massiliensis]
MANLLGVTNPVPGHDSTTTNRSLPVSPNDTHIQNIPDPTRVGRADARTDRQDTADTASSNRLRYDSNFQSFLQRLRENPEMVTTLSRLLMSRQGIEASSGMEEGIATELAELIELFPMDESELLNFFTGQLKAGNRFGGALFNILRDAYFAGQPQSIKNDILQFLKRYSDYSSTHHIEGNILRSLQDIADAIPGRWAAALREMIAKLQAGMTAGDRAGNLKLLQDEIFPYMAKYTEQTHDMGLSRGLLTMLALDTSRYENGSPKAVMQTFEQLTGYTVLKEKLGGLERETMLRLLVDTDFHKAAAADRFADKLASAASRALRGEGGTEMEAAFREIVSAMLVNESVYMPVSHYLLPMQWGDKMMFSELWIDPDAENGREQQDGEPNTIRFLFKMDIQTLGMFDMVLSCQGEAVKLQVYCPEKIAPFSRQIEQSISGILTQNGLKAEAVQVSKMERPLTISEVFPKIFEGKSGINVKI